MRNLYFFLLLFVVAPLFGQQGSTSTSASVTIFVMPKQPAHVLACDTVDQTVSVNVFAPNCFGGEDGAASVSAAMCLNADDCSFTWDSGDEGPVVEGLAAGTYSLTIYNELLDCTIVEEVVIPEPDGFDGIEIVVSDASCANNFDGSLNIVGLGSLSTFELLWDDGGSDLPRVGLGTGSYSAEIFYGEDCVLLLEAELGAPAAVEVLAEVQDVQCKGADDGRIIVDVSSEEGVLEWSWSGPVGFPAYADTLEGLVPGVYEILVLDSLGCSFTNEYEIFEPDSLYVNASIFGESCPGEEDGSINLNFGGGTGPYEIIFDGNSIGPTFSTNYIKANIPGGNYEVSIIDARGCVVDSIFEIPKLDLAYEIEQPSAFSTSDGSIVLMPSGGVAPYTVIFDGEEVGSDLLVTGLGVGIYNFSVIDATGCQYDGSVTVTFVVETGTVELLADLKISPNPSTDGYFSFDSSNTGLHSIEALRVYDFYGRMVLQESDFQLDRLLLDLSLFGSGVFILELEQAGARFSKKLVVLGQ